MTNTTNKNSNGTSWAGTLSHPEQAFPNPDANAVLHSPKLDYIRRQANRQLPTPQLLQLLHNEAPQLWKLSKVVGRWVWIAFPERPSLATTTTLSQFGFSWNKARRAWQHPCGDVRSAAASYDPRRRYGSRSAFEIQADRGGQSHE
jgi:hypothetical protein